MSDVRTTSSTGGVGASAALTDSGSGSSGPTGDVAGSRAGSGAGADARGKSTSFETVMGRFFVDRGFLTVEELDACRAMQAQSTESGAPRALADILVENEYVTRKQLERVRNDLEAEKSTQQIPGYKIMRKLGSGAMATVFLGKQLSLDRLVAIKVLPSKFSSNEKFIQRFYKEGKAAAQLNHRNIVGAFDVGQAGEHHYFVMEYVDGDTVYDRILKHKRIPEKTAIEIVRQVAEALDHAHGKGFIHRDIKPKNIMLSKDGTAKLADLGLARAVSDKEAAEAEAGRAYGTPYYISPEQIRGEVNIGPQADIYGLGATFYHMVTGKVPFEGKNPSAVMHKHLKSPLVPPDHVYTKLSAPTAQVIEMMMAKSRKDRYQSVKDLIVDLDHLARGEPLHFARDYTELKSIAESIEEVVPSEPVQPMRPASGTESPMGSPAFLAAAGVAAISIIVNLILIMTLMSRPATGSSVGAGTPLVSPGAPVATSSSIFGSWESTQLSGARMASVSRVIFVFGKDSRGHYIVVDRNGDAKPVPIDYSASGNRLTIHVDGYPPFNYTYSMRGDTVIMERDDDMGRISMVLQRVN
ncbi:MAG: serine/threonine protein kinase [Phycisphaeraceae bacterium]|nr:MAG: serine/threonine protein kinase [Phycisphaeraceae bacterium]